MRPRMRSKNARALSCASWSLTGVCQLTLSTVCAHRGQVSASASQPGHFTSEKKSPRLPGSVLAVMRRGTHT